MVNRTCAGIAIGRDNLCPFYLQITTVPNSRGARKSPETNASGLQYHGGDKGIRTLGLCLAKAALSQLSYIPMRSAQKIFCQDGAAVSTKNYPASRAVGLVAATEGVPAFVLADGQGHVKEVGEDLIAH